MAPSSRGRIHARHTESRVFKSVGVFNGVALFVAWTPRGEDGDIPHLISARKAESHEAQAWSRHYQKGR